LSGEQEAALKEILSTRGHIILTGKAGSGKTTVVNHLAAQVPVVLCATTARAALHIGGTTVDRVFRMRRDPWKITNETKLAEEMLRLPDRIVIDESSMVGAKMAALLGKIAKAYRKQLILVGDWAQASPVKDEWAIDSDLIKGAKLIRLTESHRQADKAFLGVLNKIREGVVDDETKQLFAYCAVTRPPEDDRFLRLFATNRETDQYNHSRLYGFKTLGIICNLMGRFRDVRSPALRKVEGEFDNEQIEAALMHSRLAHQEPMRIGARILMTVNDQQEAWVNGDQGIVTDMLLFDGRMVSEIPVDIWSGAPQVQAGDIEAIWVKLDRAGFEVPVARVVRPVLDPHGEPLFELMGFPLKLGWALSIHKSQGMTVDRAFIDMGSIMRFPTQESKHGLAYVALSRTRTLDGLKIANWTDDAVYCSPKVKGLL
jgi:ATP-dependent exoDNAse (exonuclease V) alpha subunit